MSDAEQNLAKDIDGKQTYHFAFIILQHVSLEPTLLKQISAQQQLFAGNAVAGVIRIELKAAVDELKATYGVVPGLAVVLVGQ